MSKEKKLRVEPITVWEDGTWGYYEFSLGQMGSEVYDDYTSYYFTTGIIRSGCGVNGVVYPLTMRTKLISEGIESYDRDIRTISRGLNFPDIHRKMVSYWQEALKTNTNEELGVVYNQVAAFVKGIRESVEDKYVDGVEIFR